MKQSPETRCQWIISQCHSWCDSINPPSEISTDRGRQARSKDVFKRNQQSSVSGQLSFLDFFVIESDCYTCCQISNTRLLFHVLQQVWALFWELAVIEELNGDFLQWLRGFYHVARTGSVRKAAQLMNRNPSTISYQLRCLERELNVVLFDRYKRAMRITAEGKRLLEWTVSTFETLKGLRASVSNSEGYLKGSVAIAATLPVLTLAVPAIVKFRNAYPGVQISLERHIATAVKARVEDSEVDFGLLPAISPMAAMEILFRAHPLLVYNRDFFEGIPALPDIGDLNDLPFIALSPVHTLEYLGYFAHDSRFAELIEKNAALSVNNNSLMLRFIQEGIGAGIMDELCLRSNLKGNEQERLACLPLDHLLPVRLYGILSRPNKRMSPQSLELIKFLRAHFMQLEELGLLAYTGCSRSEYGCSDGDRDCRRNQPGDQNHKRGALPDGHCV